MYTMSAKIFTRRTMNKEQIELLKKIAHKQDKLEQALDIHWSTILELRKNAPETPKIATTGIKTPKIDISFAHPMEPILHEMRGNQVKRKIEEIIKEYKILKLHINIE